MKSKDEIIEQLHMAIQLIGYVNPSPAAWICSVDLVVNVLADMIMHKREVIKESLNVESSTT